MQGVLFTLHTEAGQLGTKEFQIHGVEEGIWHLRLILKYSCRRRSSCSKDYFFCFIEKLFNVKHTKNPWNRTMPPLVDVQTQISCSLLHILSPSGLWIWNSFVHSGTASTRCIGMTSILSSSLAWSLEFGHWKMCDGEKYMQEFPSLGMA